MKLLHGDCVELLAGLPDKSVDMVLTDPPYGIDYQSGRRKLGGRMPKIKNDKKPYIDFIKHIPRILKESGCALIFSRWDVQQAFIDELERQGLQVQNVVVWDKKNHSMGDLKRAFGNRYETIIFCSGNKFAFKNKRPSDIVSCAKVPPAKMRHPNEKPVNLLMWLIENCCPWDGVVLDCFMGSGSAGVAAARTYRDFIGIELDEIYFKTASKRIEGYVDAGGKK